MVTGIEPITLPWKRPEKGVSAAELGASFRIEQREDGWHCTVRVGRRAEVLATGMRRLRDAQCRAEAHAATLPEVAAALAQADAAKTAAKGPDYKVSRRAYIHDTQGLTREAADKLIEQGYMAPGDTGAGDVLPPGDPRVTRVKVPPVTVGVVVENKTRAAVPTFEQVSDGCICGKIAGGTWIADPAGKVSVPAGTDPELAQEICRVAAKHYAAKREATVAAKTAAAAAKTAAKAVARAAAKTAKTVAKTTAKAKAAANTTAKTAKTTAKTAETAKAAKTTAKTAKTTAKTAKTATTARTTTTAKTVAAAEPAADKAKGGRGKAGKKAAKRTAKGPKGRGKGKQASAQATATATATEEPPMGKRGKGKGEACGCVTWSVSEGKARGEAKHGAFVVEPEGKRHALYFYDPDGQSRHLQSGEAGKLRKVAEEMAARGQPAPRTAASATDDAALMRAFMGGAMEDEA
ncbi:MAG: hypothetical protein H0T76_24565 [Nannocystis sp.]|nr:hypothetical protein [Nannocystis sp.]MBA3549664.1 hypothetical protein [Nannocystis sp.]